MRRRWLGTAVVAGTLAVVAAGAPPAAAVPSAEAIVEAAPERALAAGSARIESRVLAFAGGVAVDTRSSGAVDLKTGRADITVATPAAPGQPPTALRVLVTDEGVVFVELPAEARQEVGGRRFVRIGPNAVAAASAGGDDEAAEVEVTDPLTALGPLAGQVRNVRFAGVEQLRGVRVVHYFLRLDLSAVVAEAPAEEREAARALVESLGGPAAPVDADMYVDYGGRMRRFQFSANFRPPGAGPGGAIFSSLELYDFGVRFSVTPPPADQVVDISELEQGSDDEQLRALLRRTEDVLPLGGPAFSKP